MARRDRSVVWSSTDGDLRKAREPDPAAPRVEGRRVKVRREVGGRRGKTVTTISNVALDDGGLRGGGRRLKMHVEHEIADGPRLSLAFRARRALLLLGAALGFAAAGATASVGAHRGATQAYLAAAPDSCEFWLPNDCPDGWLEWPAEKSPYDSPPTAVTPARVRLYASGRS